MHGIRTKSDFELVQLGIQASIMGLVATEMAIGRELKRRREAAASRALETVA